MNLRPTASPYFHRIATRDTLANGTYPILRKLYFVAHMDPTKVKPAIKAFLDFVKGPEGQKILAGL